MSYIHSLRFKLMLLCVIPVVSCALLFIGHSVVIAFQVKDIAADTYLEAIQNAEGSEAVVQAVENAAVDMSWITKQWLIVFSILLVCFYIPITINIAKFIKPIRQLANYSGSLAKGDVDITVTRNRTDELGILQDSFHELVISSQKQAEIIQKMAGGDISCEHTPLSEADIVGLSIVKMLEGNNTMMSQLSNSTRQMTLVSRQIADSSHALASGSTQQAAAIERLSSTVTEVAKIPHESMKLAQNAMDIVIDVKSNAENGNQQMKNMVQAVTEIREASVNIQKVIKVIDDIAFQTNILALNAAVEAARAGQHGKGFAVVAEEVRNLATKSAEAAKNTGDLIANSMEKADLGVRIVSETHASIEGIVTGIHTSNAILAEIVDLSGSQDVSITHISENLKQMSEVVHSNSAMAEEYAASSEEMTGEAESIFGMVSQYKLRPKTN